MPEAIVELLTEARKILVFTGAGISTGSGIRDFRGPKGVWKTRQPVYYEAFMSSEGARVEYWDQKLEAWPSFRDAEPNAAHRAVAALEQANKLLSSQPEEALALAGQVRLEASHPATNATASQIIAVALLQQGDADAALNELLTIKAPYRAEPALELSCTVGAIYSVRRRSSLSTDSSPLCGDRRGSTMCSICSERTLT